MNIRTPADASEDECRRHAHTAGETLHATGSAVSTRSGPWTQPVQRAASVLVAGLICGLVAAMFSISAAALLFSSVLTDHISVAIGICLFGTAVLSAIIALSSSYPGMVSVTQEVTVVTLAVIATSIHTTLTGTRSEAEILATVIVMIGVATSASGLALFAMGTFRLGRLIRFIPYPVIGGFLAGMGWLIVTGAMAVVVGEPLTLQSSPLLWDIDKLAKWLPAVLFALLVDSASRRSGSSLVLPVAIVAALGVFHASVWMLDLSVPQLQQTGWLFQPPPGDQIPIPLLDNPLAGVDWQVVWGEAPKMIALVAISATSVLFASSGIELSIKRDIDLDRELRAAGFANIVAGAGGGAAGFQGLGLTLLAKHLGAPYRLVGVLVAGTCAGVLFFGAILLSFIPVPLFGGLLIWIGWTLLRDWLISIYARVTRREYVVILLIVFLIVTFGLLQGVLAGVCAAAALFTLEYSRVSLVKYAVTGETFHSRIERNQDDRDYLNIQGRHILVLRIQGFVFFGSVHRLHRYVSARLGNSDDPHMRFLVLDCRDVTGLDSSAMLSVLKICEMVGTADGKLIISNLNPTIRDRLIKAAGASPPMLFLDEADEAIAWCEDRLLRQWADRPDPSEMNTIAQQVIRELGVPAAFQLMRPYLERLDLAPQTNFIQQGAGSQDIFFIERGWVTVELEAAGKKPIHLRTLGPGAIVGEISFCLQRPRIATAIAKVQTTVWRLSQDNLTRMTTEQPEIAYAFQRYLLSMLAERLEHTNRLVRSLTD